MNQEEAPMTSGSETNAKTFRQLHAEGLLVLPNAWDGGSARLMESVGAKAVATSSAAVAWTHGYPDGDALPVRLLIATVSAIARVIRVPLSVDVEGGYSPDPIAAGETVAQVIGAGAVGINLEDGTSPPDLLCAKIEAVKRAAARQGVELFVNARADVYLHALAPPERRVQETLARAARYREAGADAIFVPGVMERAEIQAITAAVGLPVNVLARPGLPPAGELAALGVRRLSAGSALAQSLYGRARALAKSLLSDGSSDIFAEGAMAYAEINALLS
jgi:2-methylisocitrate lyase-like PEP mutase family enzyme